MAENRICWDEYQVTAQNFKHEMPLWVVSKWKAKSLLRGTLNARADGVVMYVEER